MTYRINLELNLSGDTARAVRELADARDVDVNKVVEQLLTRAVSDTTGDTGSGVAVAPYTINEGSGGFHLFTVVTDGYGSLISEDAHGKQLARVTAESYATDDASWVALHEKLTRETLSALDSQNDG